MAQRTVTIRVPKRGKIRAVYEPGGNYIDLYLGDSAEAYEAINVWSYGKNEERDVPDVRAVVNAWVREMDSDPKWSTWYEDILAATKA
jgi:hypothetical protein